MSDSYKEIEQKTRQYWYVDGTAEIFIGLLLAVTGALVLAMAVLTPVSWLALLILSPISLAAGLSLSLLLRRIVARR